MTGKSQSDDRSDNQRTAMRIGFFTAAAYCNWLSEREGIPEGQWIYIPNENGEIGPGMKIAEDHLHRCGYQIPTPDLWEYACRGGSNTPRYYGIGTELSSSYIRWAGTRTAQHERFAARLPNRFGLFDMLGNSAEWSTGLVDQPMNGPRGPGPGRFPRGQFRPGLPPGDFAPERFPSNNEDGDLRSFSRDERPAPQFGRARIRNGRPGLAFGGGPILVDAAGKTIENSNQFVVLGGAFDAPAHKIRCSDRSIISPPVTNKPLTLRLMQVIPSVLRRTLYESDGEED